MSNILLDIILMKRFKYESVRMFFHNDFHWKFFTAWVSQIQDKDSLASELLYHLPLLRSNNNEAKHHYLNAIPKVFIYYGFVQFMH